MPKFSETPGEVRWSATWEEGSHNRDVYGGLLGLSDDELAAAAGGGRPVSVTICDVGPRDGLQNDEKHLDPATRAELVNRLAAAGVPRIEAVSFVNPARVPQMAGAEEVVAGIERRRRASSTPGSPSTSAATTGSPRRASTRCTSPSRPPRRSTERNPNASPEESLAAAARDRRPRARGRHPRDGDDRRAFGCPFEGAIDPAACSASPRGSPRAGADEIVFADTVGVGVPRQVRQLVGEALKLGAAGRRPPPQHAQHRASRTRTRRSRRARRCSTRRSAGIGGCPFAPRATGNICTEDLVYLLHGEGVETGIDLDALIAVAEWLEGVLGRQLPGKVYRAGTFAPVAG